jgi:hypothetical protein
MDQNFIIEEFDKYKVFLYGRKYEGEQSYYGIDLMLPSGRAYLRFCRDFMKDNHVVKHGDKNHYFVYLDDGKYAAFIDILRNEMPLFFYYNFDNDSFYVTSSDEPVGENEFLLQQAAK